MDKTFKIVSFRLGLAKVNTHRLKLLFNYYVNARKIVVKGKLIKG
jgi:hypothetical protein|tara:strand:+ start:384 stop:518 length:135 start_codon:yes stop_codon:yes gene_type:complete